MHAICQLLLRTILYLLAVDCTDKAALLLLTTCTHHPCAVCPAAAAAVDLDGSNLPSFLAAGRPEWSTVRWIVVDGVSGDVLQVSRAAIGRVRAHFCRGVGVKCSGSGQVHTDPAA
jgi:hypothetical protein